MDAAALGELRANAQAAIAGSPEAAEQLGASLQAAMLTASEGARRLGKPLADCRLTGRARLLPPPSLASPFARVFFRSLRQTADLLSAYTPHRCRRGRRGTGRAMRRASGRRRCGAGGTRCVGLDRMSERVSGSVDCGSAVGGLTGLLPPHDADGCAPQALPLVAMDVLLPAARCVVASEAAGTHFQQLLNGMAASCAAREVFSAALEAVQCLARWVPPLAGFDALLSALPLYPALHPLTPHALALPPNAQRRVEQRPVRAAPLPARAAAPSGEHHPPGAPLRAGRLHRRSGCGALPRGGGGQGAGHHGECAIPQRLVDGMPRHGSWVMRHISRLMCHVSRHVVSCDVGRVRKLSNMRAVGMHARHALRH